MLPGSGGASALLPLLPYEHAPMLDTVTYPVVTRPNVPHVRQSQSWDCGLACVEMLARSRGIRNCSLLDLVRIAGTQSTWTIDLAFVLRSLGVAVSMCTSSPGVRAEYEEDAFYKDGFVDDAVRVRELFVRAADYGIDVRTSVLDADRLLAHVAYRGPAIVLVNARLLRCEDCCSRALRSCLRCVYLLSGNGSAYFGHYVLVVGYSDAGGSVLYHDPSKTHRLCRTPVEEFDNARHAFGTDDDVLLIDAPSAS